MEKAKTINRASDKTEWVKHGEHFALAPIKLADTEHRQKAFDFLWALGIRFRGARPHRMPTIFLAAD